MKDSYLQSEDGLQAQQQPTLKGLIIDNYTRCEHYHSEIDIIAIKFKCCNTYYPCYQCHDHELTHDIDKWNTNELEYEKVVLCGNCKTELTFNEYIVNMCKYCHAQFNPNCKLHYNLYFNLEA